MQPAGVTAQALPPAEDPPEEILQILVTEQANAQQSGQSQWPEDYALQQQQIRVSADNVPAKIDPDVQQLIELLRIRKVLKTLVPLL